MGRRLLRATGKLCKGSLTALKAEEHFVVVGAGVAGLTSSYILLQLGHKVTWRFHRQCYLSFCR